MALTAPQQAPATGFYEWVLPGFMRSNEEEIDSPTFQIGGYMWRLQCKPRSHHYHVGLHLWYTRGSKSPPGSPHCPDAAFTLTVKNHKDEDKAVAQDAASIFCSTRENWGFDDIVRRAQLASGGFLAKDGSLTVRVDITVNNPRQSCMLHTEPVVADFLSLLDDPGATSDLTVIVGGGNSVAAGASTNISWAGSSSSSSTGGSGAGGGAGGGEAVPAMACQPRSFHVHRALLAARCPYFRTFFSAGMADSAARELPLPDADPDAFAVLLRYMYGGEVPHCERAVHHAAVPLCDTLQLPKAKQTLTRRLVESADASNVLADLLWAAQAGQEEILEELLGVYKRGAKHVDPAQVVAMAATNPQLAARLPITVTEQEQEGRQEQEQEGQQQEPSGGTGQCGRKRARE